MIGNGNDQLLASVPQIALSTLDLTNSDHDLDLINTVIIEPPSMTIIRILRKTQSLQLTVAVSHGSHGASSQPLLSTSNPPLLAAGDVITVYTGNGIRPTHMEPFNCHSGTPAYSICSMLFPQALQ